MEMGSVYPANNPYIYVHYCKATQHNYMLYRILLQHVGSYSGTILEAICMDVAGQALTDIKERHKNS